MLRRCRRVRWVRVRWVRMRSAWPSLGGIPAPASASAGSASAPNRAAAAAAAAERGRARRPPGDVGGLARAEGRRAADVRVLQGEL